MSLSLSLSLSLSSSSKQGQFLRLKACLILCFEVWADLSIFYLFPHNFSITKYTEKKTSISFLPWKFEFIISCILSLTYFIDIDIDIKNNTKENFKFKAHLLFALKVWAELEQALSIALLNWTPEKQSLTSILFFFIILNLSWF